MIEQDQIAAALVGLIELDLVSVQIYESVLDRTKRETYYELIAGLRDDHEQHAADLLRFLNNHVSTETADRIRRPKVKEVAFQVEPSDTDTPLELIKDREEVVIDAYYHAQMLTMPSTCRDLLRKNARDEERQLFRITQAIARQLEGQPTDFTEPSRPELRRNRGYPGSFGNAASV